MERFTPDNSDCTGAIFIKDTIFTVEQAVRGFGNKLEIKENPKEDKQWFEREHHSTWYKFRVPVKCKLTFDIIPKDPNDDIDFLLFEGAIPGICDKIASRQVVPIRSNISRNDLSKNSRCGLSKDAADEYVRSGIGASHSKYVEVEAGQLMYLVVDHQERPRAGYTIHFHYDAPPPPPSVEMAEKPKRKQLVNVKVLDAITEAPLEASITIEGLLMDKVIEGSGKDHYTYEMDAYRNLLVSCVRSGYMFSSMRVKGCSGPEVNVDMKLMPIKAGEQVILDNIRFVGDADKVMRESEGALLLLLRFMQMNPHIKIEVQGHVNGPTFKNKKEFIELSKARAKSVYDFLLVNDIDASRITYVGLGNSKMLYPDPKGKEQSEANRRVEIRIIGT